MRAISIEVTHAPRVAACLLAATLAATGCETRGPLDGRVSHPEVSQVLRDMRRRQASVPASSRDVALPANAGVEDFVRLALERSPRIRAAEHRVARLHERIEQARSLDDPMFEVSPVGEMAETAAGMVGLMTMVSQRVPWPGKLDARGRMAGQDVAAAVAELQRVRLEVAADTRRAYWSHFANTRAAQTARQSREVLGAMTDVIGARLRAGLSRQAELLRVTTELTQLDARILVADQQAQVSAAMLNTLLDRPASAPVTEPPAVELAELTVQLEGLVEEARQRHPAVRALRERIEGYREQKRLARLERWPDPTFGLTYNVVEDEGHSPIATGDDQWWVTIGFNIPLWQGRRAAAEREAEQGIHETLAELHGVANSVEFRVHDAATRVAAQHQLATLLRDVLLPQAARTTQASMNDFRAGGGAFADVIDNWRAELEYRLAYDQALAQLRQSLADLDEAVGRAVPAQGEYQDGKVQP